MTSVVEGEFRNKLFGKLNQCFLIQIEIAIIFHLADEL